MTLQTILIADDPQRFRFRVGDRVAVRDPEGYADLGHSGIVTDGTLTGKDHRLEHALCEASLVEVVDACLQEGVGDAFSPWGEATYQVMLLALRRGPSSWISVGVGFTDKNPAAAQQKRHRCRQDLFHRGTSVTVPAAGSITTLKRSWSAPRFARQMGV